jgi:PAS domain S-box-containing protein
LWPVRGLPELFDIRVAARSLAYLFLAGSALGLLTLAFPHSDLIKDRQLIILAAVASAMAAAIWVWADRMRKWQLHAALATGTVILSFANYFVEATVLYPLLYTWTALFAFYFFRLDVALAHVALIAVCYAIVLILVEPSSPVVLWLLAVGTPLVAGLLISRLLARIGAGVQDSERRARALRESEARTRLVLDGAPDAFVTLDRDGVITSWNTAAERLFGWTAAEAVGVPMRSLIMPPEFRERHDERRRALIETPRVVATQRYDVELLRRDGSRFPAEATVSKIEIKGEPFISGFVRDVTERVRRQQEREALLREQAARAEAERVNELISGMQLLVDAALAHRTLDDILEDLILKVRGVLDADAATILLAEDDERLTVAASSGPELPGGEEGAAEEVASIAFGEGFAGRVASAQEAMLAHGPPPEDLPDPALRALDIDSLIGVPLLAENRVTGVLVAASVAPRRFSPEDLALLRLAADRVALAILHARVYQREHNIAETLQRSLLTEPQDLPKMPGLEVAARYEPAAAEAEVGGDWYDVIPTPSGGVGLVMGDVAGKGLAAASMVGRLRSALRAYALEGHDPARVVEQLNRLVWTEAPDSQMATLLYMVVEPGESRIDWVNAGHLAPLLANGSDAPEFLEGSGSVPLGVLPFPSYATVSATMEPGSSLVLYTDGLIERPGEHLDDGLAELAARVREAPEDPEQLCEYLLETLVPAGGASDDVAILTLRNLPFVERFSFEFTSEPEALSKMRSIVRRWLHHAGAADRELAEIVTACGEAATNAIEHAGAAAGVPFEVSGRLRDGEVEIAISDQGRWRPPREGDQGRGLALMRALMDTVEVSPSPQGTTVRLRRILESNGGVE